MNKENKKVEENEEVITEVTEEVQETTEKVEAEIVEEKVEEVKEPTSEDKIAELEAKLKESEDKYYRVHADFENVKKRLEKEKYAAIDYASEKFAKDLLTSIDTLEMALTSSKGDLESSVLLEKLQEGIELTVKNFNTAFEKHDISLVETDGEFNPNIHDAVMQLDSADHENNFIVAQLQKGYMFKNRLLRAAMVSICKK
ncbi:MAG: nucleotide exchange factor GrpE [Campylobacteraceae bacterium]|nr:nucleotide exchange factor GrpE [Campylobacteraceae bacterium]